MMLSNAHDTGARIYAPVLRQEVKPNVSVARRLSRDLQFQESPAEVKAIA